MPGAALRLRWLPSRAPEKAMPHVKRRAPSPIGRLLKQWRSQRKLSQVALALEAGISSRHLAFIEVGRSTPSRDMVLRLGAALELPLRERNLMLQAAGHAPEFPQTELGAPEMDQVRGALEFILAQHQPNPAALMNVNYDILMGNRPFELALVCFGIASIVVYANLGEKTPWLAVHQVWAFFPLAGAQLARTFGPRGRTWSRAIALLAIAATAAVSLRAVYLHDREYPAGPTVEALHYATTVEAFRERRS